MHVDLHFTLAVTIVNWSHFGTSPTLYLQSVNKLYKCMFCMDLKIKVQCHANSYMCLTISFGSGTQYSPVFRQNLYSILKNMLIADLMQVRKTILLLSSRKPFEIIWCVEFIITFKFCSVSTKTVLYNLVACFQVCCTCMKMVLRFIIIILSL